MGLPVPGEVRAPSGGTRSRGLGRVSLWGWEKGEVEVQRGGERPGGDGGAGDGGTGLLRRSHRLGCCKGLSVGRKWDAACGRVRGPEQQEREGNSKDQQQRWNDCRKLV